MKGSVRSFKSLDRKEHLRIFSKYQSGIPKKEKKMTELEILARMWIQCDPNRMDTNPDSLIDIEGGSYNGQPEWKWYVPRAEASLAYFDKMGFKLVKK